MIKYCNFHIVNKYKSHDGSDTLGKFWHDINYHWHRDFDLPAISSYNGTKRFIKHGKWHRVNPFTKKLDIDFPAVIFPNGEKQYWKNNICYEFKNNRWKKYK